MVMIQSSPETPLHWFYTNAPAAWISALIAIVTCGFLLLSRKKPRRLVFREHRNTSVVSIRRSVRDKVKVTFDDRPIGTLGQIDGEIFNEGSEPIQRPSFTLSLSEESVVLDASMTPQDLGAQSKIERNTVTITLPYLNPVREHRQIVKLSLLVDGATPDIGVVGGGEGWSVRHVPLPGIKQELYWNLSSIVSMLIWLAVAFSYGRYVEKRFGIPMSEVSWRAAIAGWPVFLLLLPVMAVPLGRFLWSYKHRYRSDR